jgi:hypothetical protein
MNADFIEQRANSDDSNKSAKPSEKKGRGRHPNSRANLKPYPKGVSGNPGGKPRVDMSAIIARAILEENQEAIYEGLAKALIKGNAYVYKELSDRAYGKVNTPVTVEAGEQLATILTEGRQRAAANRSTTALAAPAAFPAPALPPAVEIVPSPAPPVAPVPPPKPVAVAKPAPPAPAVKPAIADLSADERAKRFFDYTTGKCV